VTDGPTVHPAPAPRNGPGRTGAQRGPRPDAGTGPRHPAPDTRPPPPAPGTLAP